jgi:hypothetical protein
LSRYERKRVINGLKAFSNEIKEEKKTIKEIKEKILEAPKGVTLEIYFSARITKGLEIASDDRTASREDIVQTATEEWLVKNKYLEEE